jgi:hypothetical protein
MLAPTDKNKVSVLSCTPRCILQDDEPIKIKRTAPWPRVPEASAAKAEGRSWSRLPAHRRNLR